MKRILENVWEKKFKQILMEGGTRKELEKLVILSVNNLIEQSDVTSRIPWYKKD